MPVTRSATEKSSVTGDGGLTVSRRYTEAGVHPFDLVEWEIRDAVIGDPAKPAVRAARGGRVPQHVVAELHQHRRPEVTSAARSYNARARELPSARWSAASPARSRTGVARAATSRAARTPTRSRPSSLYILLNQLAAVNSPVWFNVGFEEHPQCSACFILSVEDELESILEWNTREGKIFRGGSGSASTSRRSAARRSALEGGLASGPVSFMRGADAWAGTIKSGGKTRRAAKMVVLDIDHPDSSTVILVPRPRGAEEAAALRDARLRHAPGLGGVRVDPVPERQTHSVPRDRRVHEGGRARRQVAHARAHHRPAGSTSTTRERLMHQIADAAWRLRRSGRPVRHDHQQSGTRALTSRPHQRVEPVLGIPCTVGRLGLQPRVDQPS